MCSLFTIIIILFIFFVFFHCYLSVSLFYFYFTFIYVFSFCFFSFFLFFSLFFFLLYGCFDSDTLGGLIDTAEERETQWPQQGRKKEQRSFAVTVRLSRRSGYRQESPPET